MALDETVRKVKRTIANYRMLTHGDCVVVGVSGGQDSVCLLDILHALRDELALRLIVAHFDHGLRPDRGEAEAHFVESLAKGLGHVFETERAGSALKRGHGSIEEMARHARYAFLDGAKKRFGAQKIAVGHHLNDQAETVLMRLLRGSGPAGLAGIPPHRDDKIIRPLIAVTRDEITAYIERKGLRYVTDATNFEPQHLRNRIRLELLPLLKQYQPRIVTLLAQTAQIMREEDDWMADMAGAWVAALCDTQDNGRVHIPLADFKVLPVALRRRIIRQVLEKTAGSLRRLNFQHIVSIDRLAAAKRPQVQVHLPNGVIAARVYDQLVFIAGGQKEKQGFRYPLTGSGAYYLEGLSFSVSLEEIEKAEMGDARASPWVAYLDADSIAYPLVIRTPQPGDRFIPLGMKGQKKLKDFFMDRKIPSETRSRTPILTFRDMPVWVCGFRIDERFRVTPETKRVLKVTLRSHQCASAPF